MKTKLYHKFVKLVCKDMHISRRQLFSRDFNDRVIHCYDFDIDTKTLIRDRTKLMVLTHKHPLSQLWHAYDFHTKWLLKHWKHSHWKELIQAHLDLGISLDDTVKNILKTS